MSSFRFHLLLPSLLALAPSLPACGGSQQEAKPPDTASEATDDDYDSTAHIGATAEVGALPEEDTAYAFKESFEAIRECFVTGARRLDYIGGEISFQVWVNTDGSVQTVFAEASTLGDHQTEECMYDVLRNAPWPKPVGGPVGVAKNAFDFGMTGDVRPPVVWEEGQVEETIASATAQIRECKHGSGDQFMATVYVDTDGSALAVGMAAPNRDAASYSECLVQVLSGLTYPPAGSWPAKVSFSL